MDMSQAILGIRAYHNDMAEIAALEKINADVKAGLAFTDLSPEAKLALVVKNFNRINFLKSKTAEVTQQVEDAAKEKERKEKEEEEALLELSDNGFFSKPKNVIIVAGLVVVLGLVGVYAYKKYK